jgi:hypothetical protein
MSDAKFDSKRRLCPDGNCIGVVGDDGRCRVCGREASGGGAKSAAANGMAAVSAAAAADTDTDTTFDSGIDDDDDNELAADAAEPGAPAFDAGRRLCSDGSCVGIIGADGKCNVCGQRASE